MSRITIIHHSGVIGGAGVSFLNTVKTLAISNEVTVFISDSPKDILAQLTILQKEFDFRIICYGKRIGALTHYSGGDSLMSLRFLYRALLIIKQWNYWNLSINQLKPDIVIINSIILSWMSMLPSIKAVKSICFVRETICGKRYGLFNRLIRKFLDHFDKTVFLSQYDCNSWNLTLNKSIIIKNFINTESLDNSIQRNIASDSLSLRHNSFHVLYVGGISHMKGFDLVVKAVLELNKEIDVELIVAGVNFEDRRQMGGGQLSKYERDIQNYILNHKYRSRIHIIGRQSNMSNCYASSDLLVFPMRSPHQARPVFEAGYYSIPAIITNFENIREAVIDGENGYLFDSENIEQLIEKIKTLAIDNDLRKKMGIRNHYLTILNHSEEENRRAIHKLID